MAILVDIFCGLFLLGFVIEGFRRGFFRSLVGWIGSLLALAAAVWVGHLLAELLYQQLFRPQVVETAESVLAAGGTPEQQAASLLAALPGFFSSALSHFGVTAAAVAGYLEGASGNAAQAVADAVSPVIVNLTWLVFAILLFLIFWVVVRLLIRLLDRVFQLPVLRQVNRLLGGGFGLLRGGAFLLLLAGLVWVAAPFFPGTAAQSIDTIASQSYIGRWFYEYNPFAVFFPESRL